MQYPPVIDCCGAAAGMPNACTMTSSLASMNGRAQMLPNYRQLMPPTAKVFTSQDGDIGVVGNVPLHKSREIANSNNM